MPQNDVWTLTFLCFDNHRALCPSVPPAMTQGNVTCQSRNSYLQRLSPSNPHPTQPCATHIPPTHPHFCFSGPRHLPRPTAFVFVPSTSYDLVAFTSLTALYPNGKPPVGLFPVLLLIQCSLTLETCHWEGSTLIEWESQGQEVEFLSGPQYSWGLFSITILEQAGWRFMCYMGM